MAVTLTAAQRSAVEAEVTRYAPGAPAELRSIATALVVQHLEEIDTPPRNRSRSATRARLPGRPAWWSACSSRVARRRCWPATGAPGRGSSRWPRDRAGRQPRPSALEGPQLHLDRRERRRGRLGLWSRALALADVQPRSRRTAALTPSLLAMVGRALCRTSEIVFDRDA